MTKAGISVAIVVAIGMGLGTVSPAAPATGPATKPRAFAVGDQVEVKWGGLWRKAVVKNNGNGWTLVNYAPGRFLEWVEPWRIRAIGSQTEIPSASPGKQFLKPEPPPKDPPKEMAGEKAGASTRPSAGPWGETNANVAAEVALTPFSIAGVNEIVVGSQPDQWALVPDGAAAPRGLAARPVVLKGGVGDGFDETAGPFFAMQANQAVLAFTNPFRKGPPTIERVDLAGAASVGVRGMPVDIVVCDVSDDGTMLLARSKGSWLGENTRLDVWKIDSSKPAHVISFEPYSDPQKAQRDITWARYIGPDRVATLGFNRRLIVWDLKSAKAIWATSISPVTPAVSGGKKQIAVIEKSRLAVLDSASGKGLASMKLDEPVHMGRLAFRPDGKQLAYVAENVVHVWDATTGSPVSEATFADIAPETIDWPSDGYVLLDGRILIDLARKMPLWHYTGAKAAGTLGGRIWYVGSVELDGKHMELTSVEIPSEAVKRSASTANADEFWAAKAGTSVSLDAGGLPGDIAPKASAALRAKLEANGFKVADGQPVRVVAAVDSEKGQEIIYHKFGEPAFSAGTQVNATPQTMKVSFLDADGKILWQRKATRSVPLSLSLKDGETIEQAVSEATRPDAAFFENMTLPKFVAKAKYRNGLGNTNLTTRGPAK